MGDLTPFQNQVLDAAARKEQEEKERQREEARQGHSAPRQNPRAGPSGGSAGSKTEQEETVRYVNKKLNPDHKVHDND